MNKKSIKVKKSAQLRLVGQILEDWTQSWPDLRSLGSTQAQLGLEKLGLVPPLQQTNFWKNLAAEQKLEQFIIFSFKPVERGPKKHTSDYFLETERISRDKVWQETLRANLNSVQKMICYGESIFYWRLWL